MASKEAYIIMLDVGSSMYEQYAGSEKTRMDVAVEAIKLLLQQKILYSKSHEVGLATFGTDEAEDGSTIVEHKIEKPTLSFIRSIDEFSRKKPSSYEGGDVIQALYDSLEILHEKVEKKKYAKKVFIITNGAGDTSHNVESLKKLARQIRAHDAKVNIIAIDFCNYLYNEDEEERNSQSAAQNRNEDMLVSLSKHCALKIFPSAVAMSIYKQFRSRTWAARAYFRGVLEIHPTLKIQVVSYTKCSQDKLPSLKKFSTVAGKSTDVSKASLDREVTAFVHDDPNMAPVEKDQAIKGYYYGKQLVPIDATLEERLKYPTTRCMKLLGFTDAKNVPRHHFMYTVHMVLPIKDSTQDTRAFASLVHACYELEKVAIIRWVGRANSAPSLAVLTPHVSTNYECFWLNTLPTSEDIRDYQFAALKSASPVQEKAISEFVDALDLMSCEDETGESFEALKPSETFNPVLQYFYQCLAHRAISGEMALPPLDPLVAQYLRPDKKMYDRAGPSIKEVINVFEFKENQLKKEKARIFWRDVINKEKERMEEAKMQVEAEAGTGAEAVGQKEKGKGFGDDEDDIVREISPVNPIEDFKKMIAEKREDLVSSALEQMMKLITRIITDSFQGNYYDKALSCLEEMRVACVDEDEAPLFNDYLSDCRDKYSAGKHVDFWRKVVMRGVTLITSNESKSSTISLKESSNFLMKQEESLPQKVEEEKKKDDFDLIADIE